MLRKLLLIIIIMSGISVKAQNQGWTATAIDGNTYNIDSIVNTGKTVLVDVSTNWCLPCWHFHLTGILEKLYREFGPDGTDDLFIFLIDADSHSSIALLSGAGGGSMGNWLLNTPYPIIGPNGQGQAIQAYYNIHSFPTLIVHCPGSTTGVSIAFESTWEAFLQNWKDICPASFNNGTIDATLLNNDELTFCDGEHPVTQLYNQGSTPLTSATVEVKSNGVVLQSINWTGNLAQYAKQDVSFHNVNLVDGVTYEFNVIVNQETHTTGNKQEVTLRVAPDAPDYYLSLDLQCNTSAAQTSWRLLDDNGNIHHSSPQTPYTPNQFCSYNWLINPNSCYTFIIRNESTLGLCCAQGNGYYNIRSTIDTTISFLSGGAFTGYEKAITFHTPLFSGIENANLNSFINVYPNPTTGKIVIHSLESPILNFGAYNLLGEKIPAEISGNELDLSSQSSGIYFLKINTEQNTIVKKINLNK